MLVRRYRSPKEHKKQKNKVFCKIECYLQILYSSVSYTLLCVCIEKTESTIKRLLYLYIIYRSEALVEEVADAWLEEAVYFVGVNGHIDSSECIRANLVWVVVEIESVVGYVGTACISQLVRPDAGTVETLDRYAKLSGERFLDNRDN